MPRPTLWHDILQEISAEIASGRYDAGDKIPTEAEFAARFGVNRHTIRRALRALIAEGRLVARQGAGVFVAHRPTPYHIGARVRFHQAIRATGRLPDRRYTLLDTRPADSIEAGALDLAQGDLVHCAEGVSLSDGVAVALFRSVFPAHRLPDMLTMLRANPSITAAFAAHGITDYLRRETEIGAVNATALQAAHLGLRVGAALIHSRAVNICAQRQTPIEYGEAYFAGDRIRLHLDGAIGT